MDTHLIDQSKAGAFADRMLNILNEDALALMSSIGHRTRLFDVMSELPPATSRRALNLMAKAFPNSRFTGYDISEEAINTGNNLASQQDLTNLKLEVKDVTSLDAREQYKLITAFDAIHDQAKPELVLQEIAKALRPDGTFRMQDIAASSHVHKNIDHPIGPLLYTLSCMSCMTVSLAANGAGLGAMWGEEKAREMLKEAGFSKVDVKKLPHDFQNAFYIIQKN